MNVKLSEEQKIKLLNSNDVFAVMQKVLLRENKIRRGQEHFWVIGMNETHKILFIELVSLGANNRVQVKPPEVFRMAIYKLASKMILVHNHPGGEVTPSTGDRDVTDMLLKIGQLINIQVVDHLIITENTYLSFEEQGIMHDLRHSGAYEIKPKEKAELERIRLELERERAVKERSMEIAKRMIEEGFDSDVIAKMTGVRKVSVEKMRRDYYKHAK